MNQSESGSIIMIGKIISHYSIIEKLGEGGMGVVYKAQDTKLDRFVALKFLPAHVAKSEQEKSRFFQEAKSASALNHPNVCTIYGIDEVEGPDGTSQQFIEMELVDGMTLRDKVASSSPLNIKQVVDYGIQIGEALQEAHSKGIIHRDIKSENIMVNSKNQIKVMDFGLAKLKGSLKLTKTSSTVGTLAYMSPEQIQGIEADIRSDIFSYGVVLFEMTTGRMPFRGEHEAAIMYSIVNEEPEDAAKYRDDVPAELQHILKKSLEKDPGDRYQSMAEIIVDLRRLNKESTKVSRQHYTGMVTPPPAKKKNSLMLIGAVLLLVLALGITGYFLFLNPESDSTERISVAVIDFENETGDTELDGLSGLLITDLEQSNRLEVITRSRMFDILRKLNMTNVERIDEATGRALCKSAGINVMALGTVRKFGELYTVDLKAIDLNGEKHLFAAKADGKGKETIPSLIDQIADRMRRELKEPTEKIKAHSQKVSDITTTNLDAYQHYFLGEQLVNKGMDAEAAMELNKAVVLDSTFGLAYFRLADLVPWHLGAEQIELARQPLKNAIALIDRIPAKEGYFIRALDAMLEQGAPAALTIMQEIVTTYPYDKEVFYNLGVYYWFNHQNSEAEQNIEKALAIDPSYDRAREMLLEIYFSNGELDKTLAEGMRRLSHDPSDVAARLIVADSYIILGDVRTGYAQYDSVTAFTKSLDSKLRVASHRAGAKVFQGRFKEGRQEFLEALTLSMSDTANRKQNGYRLELNLGLLEDRLQNYSVAVKHFSNALKFSPNMLRIYRDLGATYARMADLVNAQKVIDSVLITRAGKDHRYYNHVMGEIYIAQKKYQLAIEALRKSSFNVGLKGSSLYCYPLAKALIGNNDIPEAIRVLEDITNSRFTLSGLTDYQLIFFYPISFYTLGTLYEQTGQKEKAIQSYQGFLKKWEQADKDLPEFIDAKNRLNKLRGVVNK